MLDDAAFPIHTFVPSKARVARFEAVRGVVSTALAEPAGLTAGLKTCRLPWLSAINTRPRNNPSFLGVAPAARLHVSWRRRSAAFTFRILPSLRAIQRKVPSVTTSFIGVPTSLALIVLVDVGAH